MTGLFEACLLCGASGAVAGTLRIGLVKWIEPIEGQEYSQLPRCSEAQACRERVEARGERWEVEDAITRSTLGGGGVNSFEQPADQGPLGSHVPAMSKAAPESEPAQDETAEWFA
jgi:hypothetical protein